LMTTTLAVTVTDTFPDCGMQSALRDSGRE
jgi:hypothetical protein